MSKSVKSAAGVGLLKLVLAAAPAVIAAVTKARKDGAPERAKKEKQKKEERVEKEEQQKELRRSQEQHDRSTVEGLVESRVHRHDESRLKAHAITAILVHMAVADGSIHEKEVERIESWLELPRQSMRDLLVDVQAHGLAWDRIRESLRTAEDRLLAAQNAVYLAADDNVLHEDEISFFKKLCHELKISRRVEEELHEVARVLVAAKDDPAAAEEALAKASALIAGDDVERVNVDKAIATLEELHEIQFPTPDSCITLAQAYCLADRESDALVAWKLFANSTGIAKSADPDRISDLARECFPHDGEECCVYPDLDEGALDRIFLARAWPDAPSAYFRSLTLAHVNQLGIFGARGLLLTWMGLEETSIAKTWGSEIVTYQAIDEAFILESTDMPALIVRNSAGRHHLLELKDSGEGQLGRCLVRFLDVAFDVPDLGVIPDAIARGYVKELDKASRNGSFSGEYDPGLMRQFLAD